MAPEISGLAMPPMVRVMPMATATRPVFLGGLQKDKEISDFSY